MGDEPLKTRRLQFSDRAQILLPPLIVEQLIREDHPARAIWDSSGARD